MHYGYGTRFMHVLSCMAFNSIILLSSFPIWSWFYDHSPIDISQIFLGRISLCSS